MKNRYEIRGAVTAIFLTRRDGTIVETLIDTFDLKHVNLFPNTWCAHLKGKHFKRFYVKGNLPRTNGKGKTAHMAHYIMKPPPGMVIDHKDGNPLNNRRSNLRIVTQHENTKNRPKINPYCQSGYRNIRIRESNQGPRYQAIVRLDGKRITLGTRPTLEEALKLVNTFWAENSSLGKEELEWQKN